MIATLCICKGCGVEFEGRGRAKWCSERCRKAQYAGTCERCGGPTDGTTPSRGVPRMCAPCAHIQPYSLERARKLAERQTRRMWSDEQLLDAVRRADRLGIHSKRQWDANRRDDLPSSATVENRFGSWNRARAGAGVSVNRPCRSYTRLTAEDCVRAVADVWGSLGSIPTHEVYEGFRAIERPDLPSAVLIRIRCGTWVQALEMAAALMGESVAA